LVSPFRVSNPIHVQMIGQLPLLASKVGHAKELLATDTDQQAKICPALHA
jgi:hypothetical protein